MKKRHSIYFSSPLGAIQISGTNAFITDVKFAEETETNDTDAPDFLFECQKQLEEYFAGKRKKFELPNLKPEGTAFQKKVWSELKKISYGTTTSYNSIAKKLKNPDSVRAVGHANGKNPIAIIIPCHRVISEDGKLTGYSGLLWRKQWLLNHEGNISGNNPTLF
jgi:methylated-DNA-[protein]-cysteine S-methyltransferase